MNDRVAWRTPEVRHAPADQALREGVALLDDLAPGSSPRAVWWEIDAPALVLGRGSRVDADEAACAEHGVAIVRRASGGGPVLWEPSMLSLDIAIPRGHPAWSADIVAAYRHVGEAFADAARAIGIDAHAIEPSAARAENDPDLAALACYAGRSPWEVMTGPRKLVGLSQVRRRSGVLVQAGLLTQPATWPLPHFLTLTAGERMALGAALDTRATSVTQHVSTDRKRIRTAVESALAARFAET